MLKLKGIFRRRPIKRMSVDEIFQNTEGLAVVLIDMQQHFIDRDFTKGEEKRIISNQLAVLKWCAANHVPVIVLEYDGRGKTIDILREELKNVENRATVVKPYDNGFEQTTLDNILKGFGAEYLFLMGINACACVLATAKEARNKGYQVATSQDVIDGGLNRHIDWYEQNSLIAPIPAIACL